MKTSKLFLICASALLFFTGCEKMPTIDNEYNPVIINADESSVEGGFRQGDQITDGKIVISYQNGLGRSAKVFVPKVNGIYSEPMLIVLAPRSADNNGNGTIEIPLKGVVEGKANITLRPTIELGTHEVFVKFTVTPTADIVTDVDGSTVSGTFKIFQPVQNGKIGVKYSSTKEHTVKISVAEVVGVYANEFEATLPAAPSGGMVEVPLGGTPSDHGNRNYVVRMIKGEDEYTVTKSIAITGEVSFNVEESYVEGDLIVGQELGGSGAKIVLKYTADKNINVNMNVAPIDGIMTPIVYAQLFEGSNTIYVFLIGTPTSDGVKTLTVAMEIDNIVYSASIPVTVVAAEPGVEFEQDRFTYETIIYTTVFVDVNGNGFVNPGEVWLDRNVGATSNDPGTYGAAGANQTSFGHFMQWGKPYGQTTYDDSYTIDYGATTPWNTLCPPNYEVPTIIQWRDAIAKITGGTISGNNVTQVPGITEKLMNSVLKLPMSGWYANSARDHEQIGLMGSYWTSSEGSNTAPWRVQINNNASEATGGGWADKAWQVPVRCIKTIK